MRPETENNVIKFQWCVVAIVVVAVIETTILMFRAHAQRPYIATEREKYEHENGRKKFGSVWARMRSWPVRVCVCLPLTGEWKCLCFSSLEITRSDIRFESIHKYFPQTNQLDASDSDYTNPLRSQSTEECSVWSGSRNPRNLTSSSIIAVKHEGSRRHGTGRYLLFAPTTLSLSLCLAFNTVIIIFFIFD